MNVPVSLYPHQLCVLSDRFVLILHGKWESGPIVLLYYLEGWEMFNTFIASLFLLTLSCPYFLIFPFFFLLVYKNDGRSRTPWKGWWITVAVWAACAQTPTTTLKHKRSWDALCIVTNGNRPPPTTPQGGTLCPWGRSWTLLSPCPTSAISSVSSCSDSAVFSWMFMIFSRKLLNTLVSMGAHPLVTVILKWVWTWGSHKRVGGVWSRNHLEGTIPSELAVEPTLDTYKHWVEKPFLSFIKP